MRVALQSQRAILLLILSSCAAPPVLTPVRIADRGPAPLARTVELRVSPTVHFEQERGPAEDASNLTLDAHDIAVRPNLFLSYAFTDALALVIPAGLLWSPIVQPQRGRWLTVGGGIYGFAFSGERVSMTNALGVWAKERFGNDVWLTGGVALFHVYDSGLRGDSAGRTSDHFVTLIPGLEVGVQLMDNLALALLADHAQAPLGDSRGYSRVRAELVLVPAWWIDLGAHAGFYVHRRDSRHLDPLVGFTVTGRW
jgi:hypothetical protein